LLVQFTVNRRPIGVSVVAILAFLLGLLLVLIGLFIAVLGIAGGAATSSLRESFGASLSADSDAAIAATFAVIGVVVGLFGFVAILFAIGAWRLKGWAWWLGLILSALYALASLSGVSTARNAGTSLTAPLVQLVIGVVVFVYLLTPGVRRAFGR
jgi:uncharacterized membrane protein (DUF2068 family)